MSALDNVIEKYTGVHRRSIVENDVQNIYSKVFDIMKKILKNSMLGFSRALSSPRFLFYFIVHIKHYTKN